MTLSLKPPAAWRATISGPAGKVDHPPATWQDSRNAIRCEITSAAIPARTLVTVQRFIEDWTEDRLVSVTDGEWSFSIAPAGPATAEPVVVGSAEPVVDHKSRGHSSRGASGAHRWMKCPGAPREESKYADRSSKAAQQGTAEHEVGEICLRTGQAAVEFVDRDVAGILIDEDAADRVQQYLDSCAEDDAEDGPVWTELPIDLASLNPPVPMFGTLDRAKYIPATQTLRIRDYKSGFIGVSPESPQLKYYALGAALALGADRPVSAIECVIVQPRKGGVKRHTYTAVELAAWSAELLAAAERTVDPNAPLQGGSWCRFCRASGSCSAEASYSLEAARLEFGVAVIPDPAETADRREDLHVLGDNAGPPLPARQVATLSAPPHPDDLTPEQKALVLERATEFRAWLSAVEDSAKADILAGGTVPGWKLVEAIGRERWRGQDGEIDDAADMLEFVHSVRMRAERPPVLSPAKARGALKSAFYARAVAAWDSAGKPKGQKPTLVAAEDAARAALSGHTVKPITGLTLAPDTDGRRAAGNALADFAGVIESEAGGSGQTTVNTVNT